MEEMQVRLPRRTAVNSARGQIRRGRRRTESKEAAVMAVSRERESVLILPASAKEPASNGQMGLLGPPHVAKTADRPTE
jgi:hypothetical protein